jgi:hypothetical protein
MRTAGAAIALWDPAVDGTQAGTVDADMLVGAGVRATTAEVVLGFVQVLVRVAVLVRVVVLVQAAVLVRVAVPVPAVALVLAVVLVLVAVLVRVVQLGPVAAVILAAVEDMTVIAESTASEVR